MRIIFLLMFVLALPVQAAGRSEAARAAYAQLDTTYLVEMQYEKACEDQIAHTPGHDKVSPYWLAKAKEYCIHEHRKDAEVLEAMRRK